MDVAWVVSAMDDFFRRGREVFFSQGNPSQIVGRKMVVSDGEGDAGRGGSGSGNGVRLVGRCCLTPSA